MADVINRSKSVSEENGSNFIISGLVPRKRYLNAKVRTIECGFTLKRVRDMTRTCSQMHRTNKYSEHSSIIWPVWPNG